MPLPRTLLALGPALGLCVAGLAPARAEEAPAACGDFAWSVARERAAFGKPDLPDHPSGSALPAGAEAVRVALKPEAEAALPVASDRPGKPGTFAGFVTTTVPAAGTYQLTLSDAAWVDVSQDGRTTLKPTAHSGKAGCPEVRKSLRFALRAGAVTIEVSNVPAGRVTLGLLPVE